MWPRVRGGIDVVASTDVYQASELSAGEGEGELRATIRRMIALLGEDPDREGLAETPRRIASMYHEMFEGLALDPVAVRSVGFEEGHDEMVILRENPF
jgi:GTP cyclohydrolase I